MGMRRMAADNFLRATQDQEYLLNTERDDFEARWERWPPTGARSLSRGRRALGALMETVLVQLSRHYEEDRFALFLI